MIRGLISVIKTGIKEPLANGLQMAIKVKSVVLGSLRGLCPPLSPGDPMFSLSLC
jgi:hypothetical protein